MVMTTQIRSSESPAIPPSSAMAPLTAAKPEEPLTDSKQTSVTLEDDSPQAAPESYEEKHVHAVYSQIASHFSHTRYKPWPIISNFLLSLPSGSLGLDVGCGNGKYLLVNPNLYIIASDRSSELVSIASTYGDRKNETVVADGLRLPHPRGVFDFAISIAVVHHLSTAERRREAIRSILSMLTTTGKAMIYAWALEQKDSRRGWDEGGEQDVMVPWVMKKSKKGLAPGEPNETTYQRYYHLYRRGELEDDVAIVGGKVLEGGYEKDNWWCICGRGEEFAEC